MTLNAVSEEETTRHPNPKVTLGDGSGMQNNALGEKYTFAYGTFLALAISWALEGLRTL